MNELLARLKQPLLEHLTSLLPEDEPVFLVGGAIRDALLNRESYDLDFVTSGDALQLARQIGDSIDAAFFPLDTRRKIARLVLRSSQAQGGQAGRLIRIDFSKFQGEDLIHDLEGRDFTINAMAVDVRHPGTLIDPLNGAQDLLARRLQACSQQSFNDDPVRILRAVRFSVDLELTISAEMQQLMKQSVELLPSVSAERLRDELFRILVQPHPSTALRILDKLGALEHILPEVCLLKGVQQSFPHVLDAWEHTLDTLARLESLLDLLAPEFNPDKASSLALGLVALQLGRYRSYLAAHLNSALNPERPQRGLLFLAGLYHDVGKRKTQSKDDAGKIKFIEHESVSAGLAEKRGKALRLSNLEIVRLVSIVSHHMRPSFLSHTADMPSKKSIYHFFRDTGVGGVDICILSLADLMATYGTSLPQDRWAHHLEVVRELLRVWWEERESNVFPAPLLNGEDLMRELGIEPGPIVGYLLEEIREAQVAGEVHTSHEAIILARKLLEEYESK